MGDRFHDGDAWMASGQRFAIFPGRKAPNDLVLKWWAEGRGWVAINYATVAKMVDFFVESEESLYPSALGFAGGRCFTNFLARANTGDMTLALTALEADIAECRQVPALAALPPL